MKLKKKNIHWLVLLVLAAGIKTFSLFPASVERYYASGIYPIISIIQRALFGWLPFSIGDLIYGVAVIYLIVKFVQLVKAFIKRNWSRQSFLNGFETFFKVALWIYIVFNLSWGLNYNRLGIGEQLQLKPTEYNVMELQAVLNISIEKLNALADTALLERNNFEKKENSF